MKHSLLQVKLRALTKQTKSYIFDNLPLIKIILLKNFSTPQPHRIGETPSEQLKSMLQHTNHFLILSLLLFFLHFIRRSFSSRNLRISRCSHLLELLQKENLRIIIIQAPNYGFWTNGKRASLLVQTWLHSPCSDKASTVVLPQLP